MSITPIQGISTIGGGAPIAPGTHAAPKTGGKFSNVVDGVISQANNQLQKAETSIGQLASGESDDFQNVVMSMAKADLSFRFILEIRNKLMDAYQEIMRMQV